MTPRLLENDNESRIRAKGIKVCGTATHLSATHQAVILAKCLLIEKSTRHDEMQSTLLWYVQMDIYFLHLLLHAY